MCVTKILFVPCSVLIYKYCKFLEKMNSKKKSALFQILKQALTHLLILKEVKKNTHTSTCSVKQWGMYEAHVCLYPKLQALCPRVLLITYVRSFYN